MEEAGLFQPKFRSGKQFFVLKDIEGVDAGFQGAFGHRNKIAYIHLIPGKDQLHFFAVYIAVYSYQGRIVLQDSHSRIQELEVDHFLFRGDVGVAPDGDTSPQFGYGRGLVCFDRSLPPDAEAIFRHVVASGEPYTATAKPFVYAYNQERGMTYWDWTLHPVKHITGQVEGVVLSLINVTNRVQFEQEMHLFKAIIEASDEAVAVCDTKGQVVYTNPAHQHLLGYLPWYPLNYRAWYSAEALETLHQKVTPILKTGGGWQGELEARNAQGRPFTLWERVNSIFDDRGNMCFAFGLMHDVTERTCDEQALRVQHQLTSMLSATNDLTEGLGMVLKTVMDIDGADCGGIYLLADHQSQFDLVAHYGLSERFTNCLHSLHINTPQVQLIHSGTPLYQPFDTLDFLSAEQRQEGIRTIAIIPIMHHLQAIGVLNIGSRSLDEFSLHTRTLLEAIAAQIGGTIVRISIEAALHESQHNLQTLFNSLDDLLFIAQQDGKIIHYNPAVEQRLGYTRDELFHMYVLDIHPAEQQTEAADVFAAMIAGEQNTCNIPLKTKNGDLIPVETRIVEGDWDGQPVLFGISRDITERKRAEEHMQRTSQQLLESNRRLKQRNQDMLLLNQMGDRLQECQNVHEAYDVLVFGAAKLFVGQSGGLYIQNPDSSLFERVDYWGNPSCTAATLAPKCCAVLPPETGASAENIASNGISRDSNSEHGKTQLYIPLVVKGEILGMLNLCHETDTEHETFQRWQQLAKNIARQMSLALTNLLLREQLEQQALHDPLTGLYNRRYLDETIPYELEHWLHQNQLVGVIMLDIDHFKQFNDTYGHEAGDHLLQAIGTFLQQNIRRNDIACRYGGEEFTLILPGTTLEDARKRAEQIRRGIPAVTVQYEGHILGSITASFGIAVFPHHSKTVAGVLKAADRALYQAKSQGRNRVVVADLRVPILGPDEHVAEPAAAERLGAVQVPPKQHVDAVDDADENNGESDVKSKNKHDLNGNPALCDDDDDDDEEHTS